MAEVSKRAMRSRVEARGHVVKDEGPIFEVSGGKLVFDGGLALEEPIHGVVEIVLVGMQDPEFEPEARCRRFLGQASDGG